MSTDMLEDSLYDPEVAAAKAGSDTMFCTDCHTPNPAKRRYCVNCGTALWEPCFRCDTLCPADGNFCGACGTDLRNTAAVQVRRFEAQLSTAEQLRANLEFDEALEILNNLATHDHPRLIERVRHVEQLVEQVTAEQARRQAEAARALAEAEELFGRCHYQEAALKLEGVPKPLRTEAIEMLLEQAASHDAEIVRLTAELQRDLQTHLDNKVFRKLMRVLELHPDHEQGLQLNKALQGRLFKQAREYLAAFRYPEAAALLEQIPVEAQLPAVKSLCTLAVELAWLWTDLRRAPHVDGTLLEVAERVCKLSPKHTKAAALRDEIRRRLKTAEQAEGVPPVVPWAAPKATSGAPPLVWLHDFRRLEPADECDTAPLLEHRGAFFTAAGLALQGLGAGKIHINLRATVDRAVIDTMRKLLAFRNPSAWGIDIGSHALKAVNLVVDRKDRTHRPRIAKAYYIPYAKDLCRAVNDEQRNDLVVEALRELLAEEESLAQSRVCVGLSGRAVMSRILDLPGVEKKKLDDLVHHEAQHHVPMKLDELTWGYQRINEEAPAEIVESKDAKGMAAKAMARIAKRAPSKKRPRHKVLLLLVKRQDAIRQLAPFRESGIRVDMVQAESAALANALFYELAADAAPAGADANADAKAGAAPKQGGKAVKTEHAATPTPSFVALDVGSEATSLVIGGPEILFIRHLHSAGEAYTRQLVQELQLTFEQAERLKHEPHTARSMAALFRAVDPITDELAEEYVRLCQTCAKEHGGFTPSQRFLTGGGARLHGFTARMNRL